MKNEIVMMICGAITITYAIVYIFVILDYFTV